MRVPFAGYWTSSSEAPERPSESASLQGGVIACLLALALGVGALLLDSSNGLRRLWVLRGELEEARLELGQLESRRADLSLEVEALEVDPFEVERRAREDLGMLRPGERVIRCCD